MKGISITPTIITIMPAIAIIPVLIGISQTIHMGGVHLIFKFINSSLHPNTSKEVLLNSWQSLQITLSIALIAWSISIFVGILLGIISSKVFWRSFDLPDLYGSTISNLLAPPY